MPFIDIEHLPADNCHVIMSNENLTTQPTIQTLLERINEIAQQHNARFDEFAQQHNARFDSLEAEVKNLRADMEKSFYTLNRRIDVMSADINKLRTDISLLDERLEKLDKQPA